MEQVAAGPWWVRLLGAALGWLAFSVLRVRRAITLANLEVLGLAPAERRRLAARVYRHLATGALELLFMGRLTVERARAIVGAEALTRLQQAMARGKGVLVLSAHLGQWDLLACAAARCGLPVTVITRRIKSGWIDRLWNRQRGGCGVRLLPAQGSAAAVVRALRHGELVAMVLDQHEPHGTIVPFFGRPAATNTSLARLARVSGAPVLPLFLVRSGKGFKTIVGATQPPLLTATDVQRATADYTECIEQQVRQAPEQWLWLHRRWKVHGPLPPP